MAAYASLMERAGLSGQAGGTVDGMYRATLELDVAGWCYYGGPILIDATLTGVLLKFAVYHELTHCLWGVGHTTERPHVMNPTIEPKELPDTWQLDLVNYIRAHSPWLRGTRR